MSCKNPWRFLAGLAGELGVSWERHEGQNCCYIPRVLAKV